MSEGRLAAQEPVRVYLDNQQFNYFVDPVSGLHPPGALRAVRRAIRRGQIEVVGSLDLLQEMLEAAPSVPKKSARMVDLFFQMVGRKVLLPAFVRGDEERIGGLLVEPDMYLPQDMLRETRRRAQSPVEARSLADELREGKDGFLREEQLVQRKTKEHLQAAGMTKSAGLLEDWISTVDLDEWVEGVMHSPGTRATDAPSIAAFTAVRLARLVRTIGQGRKIAGSDLADAHHVAGSPYFDLLVTDDKELRASLDLVAAHLSFDWVPSSTFLGSLDPTTAPLASEEGPEP